MPEKRIEHGRRCRGGRIICCAVLAVLGLALWEAEGHAQSTEDFFKNKRIDLMIGYDPGASYDAYGRLLARHLGSHIPGTPSVVPMNKPGAGSLVAANTIFQESRKDGTVVGVLSQSVYFTQLIGQSNIKYDALQFNWIGRITNVTDLVIVWHESKAKTIADLQHTKVTVAVGGAISGSTFYVNFMNAMLGTKFEPIKGYDGNAPMLAMERGEIDATASVNWFGLQASHPHWLRDKKINILVQIGLERAKGLEHIPLLPELAKNESDRKILVALASTDEIGRSLVAPPGLPPARLGALRSAFMATVKSANFLADAKKMNLSINPMSGEDLAKLVANSGDLTPEMVAKIRKMTAVDKI
jgi:tripartite-type tricarboxylate transporter receptor subunit TctC